MRRTTSGHGREKGWKDLQSLTLHSHTEAHTALLWTLNSVESGWWQLGRGEKDRKQLRLSQSNRSCEFSLPGFQKEKYPEEFSLLKSQTKDGQRPEWTFYPRFSSNIHTYHVGKQCFFSGVFRGNRRSVTERTVDKTLGRKKYDIDPRNGIPKLTPGDNPYMFPEQSKEFFKAGSTLPPVNFSLVPYEKKFDTFIPLEPLPQIPNLPFWEKEKANNLKNEIKEVQELDNWQASPSFLHSFFSSGASNFPRHP
ncbi:hypothetical protein HispidOSU_023230 [Sigmodon hispidus]